MNEKLWWQESLRVIQTNLQVRDTALMNPEKIAAEIQEMAGNVLVMNVGGIYAWYQSEVKFHHINEFLPNEYDLLECLIEACHARNIKVIARFDFSKAEDLVYFQKPHWFVRKSDKAPLVYGAMRPGDWSLLFSTCINAGYRNQEVAVPVLEEVIDRYAIDGIFFNAPHYEYCCCSTCKTKYRAAYGVDFPETGPEKLEPDWASRCIRENMQILYKAVKHKTQDIPLILYYNLYKDNLFDRATTADMICTESQDVLSLGFKEIPQFWKPALSMKLGRSLENYPVPFGIIHSCPGMDWRHTGLPTAEYLFWMSQIPAGGGHIWHSITGFNDTISDKRIIQSISSINRRISNIEKYMDGAVSAADTLLLWNSKSSGEGWAEALVNSQIQFDVIDTYQVTLNRLQKYALVIVPGQFNWTEEIRIEIEEYLKQGGKMLIESSEANDLVQLAELAGIEPEVYSSEYLTSAYWQFENNENSIFRNGFEETPLIALRGVLAYCKPKKGTQTLATLVPPFAPLDAVGAPPERANIRCNTDLPLCTTSNYGTGQVLLLTFQLSLLVKEFKLAEHYKLAHNLVSMMLLDQQKFRMNSINGLQAMVYEKDNQILVHLVNGIGQRPLVNTIPYHNIELSILIPSGKRVSSIISCIEKNKLTYTSFDDKVDVHVEKLEVWDLLVITIC